VPPALEDSGCDAPASPLATIERRTLECPAQRPAATVVSSAPRLRPRQDRRHHQHPYHVSNQEQGGHVYKPRTCRLNYRVDGEALLGAAVTSNALWCDAVCRSHGYPGAFSDRLWMSPDHDLEFYPNAITLPDGTLGRL